MVKEVVSCGRVGGSGIGADGALVYLSVSVWQAEWEALGEQRAIYLYYIRWSLRWPVVYSH